MKNQTKYGTCYFPTRADAVRYYRDYSASPSVAVAFKLAEGSIRIGKPPMKPGDTLTIEDGRYHVTEAAR